MCKVTVTIFIVALFVILWVITEEKESCINARCPVDGGWTNWDNWGLCSVTCGDGIRERRRSCTNPMPSENGKQCEGDTVEKGSCYIARCRIDGAWTNWDNLGLCSVTCGDGIRERIRSCTNPMPSENGKQCEGDTVGKGSCYIARCRIDGRWTEWSSWGACSVTCGNGIRERSRLCAKSLFSKLPDMSYCGGITEEKESCNNSPCPEDGGWTRWSNWSTCSLTCGYGFRKRTRSCTNPRPKGSGKKCLGRSDMIIICAYNPCPEG